MVQKSFDEIVQFARTGLNPRKNFQLGNGSNKYITIKNIHNNTLVVDENTDVVDDDAIKLIHKRSQIKKGDILFCSIGRMGDMYIIEDDPVGWDINESVFAFTLDTNIIRQKYFYYIFKNQNTLDYLGKNSSGSTFKSIKMNQLKKMAFNLPSLEEQDLIVGTLDKVSSIIEARNNELGALDELIKARFVEMFGDPLSGTEKWPIHTVGDVANSVDPQPSHRTPPVDESGIPYVSIKDCDYKTGKIDFKNARKVGRNVLEEHLQRYELNEGDFIIGKIGTIGNPIFVPARKDYTLSANIVLIQPKKETVSPYFLKCSFMSAYMDQQFEEAKNSTSQAAFGIQKVRAIKVMNPPIDIQYQFEDFAKQVDKSKVA